MRSVLNELHRHIFDLCGEQLTPTDWSLPPKQNMGDVAIPCFRLAKALFKAPAAVAVELSPKILERIKGDKNSLLEDVQASGPYINAKFSTEKLFSILIEKLKEQKFGSSSIGNGKSVVIDFSSPNVGKEIALHHLRSTAIGAALGRIAEYHGFSVHKLNYLGDWGTTFGKLLCGLRLFGKEEDLKKGGLSYMLDLYVRFNKEEKTNPKLGLDAREAFKLLEEGDAESFRIWKLFRELSVSEFKRLYSRLGIDFDFYDGESLYRDKLDTVIDEIQEKIGTRVSEGALICELPGHELPILLRKDDGASLYITRDLAAIEDRFQRFHFDMAWYVVAVQQRLHFQQLFDVVKALHKPYTGRAEHVYFGMLSFASKTMKTREGNVIFLNDVLDEAKNRALEIIRTKNAELKNADDVAEMIGQGALLFSDLSQHRTHDVKFDWEKALSFEGDTAPFVQYTYARATSLIKKVEAHMKNLGLTEDPHSFNKDLLANEAFHSLLADIWFFEIFCERALTEKDPSQIATSVLNIAKSMNQLYHKIRFLDESTVSRLSMLLGLSRATRFVLKKGLFLLGIRAPEEM